MVLAELLNLLEVPPGLFVEHLHLLVAHLHLLAVHLHSSIEVPELDCIGKRLPMRQRLVMLRTRLKEHSPWPRDCLLELLEGEYRAGLLQTW